MKSIVQTTEFECALQAKPVGAGKNVYFAVNRDTFAGIREYYTDERTLTKDATDVTSHCPRYIPRGIVKMVAATNEDALVVLSEADRRSLYVYRYYWDSPQEKLQSAWSRWEFGPDDVILNCDFIESVLWVVVSRPSGTFIESLSFAPVSTESGSLMRVHLDRLVTQASVLPFYSSVAGTTSFTLPYTPEVAGAYQCISGNGVILPFRLTGAVVTVPGNVSAFSFGRRYVMRYRFSPLVIRENTAGGSPSAVTSGRVQVRQMLLNYANTGYFRVEVTPLGGQTFSYVFSGRILGSAQNVVGSAAIETGSFKFPVVAKNDQVTVDLVNDSFLPCSFTSAEWEAMFTTRARRV